MEHTLTYEQLFEALRREKSREELQELDDAFYDQARALLAQKMAIVTGESATSLAGQRAGVELQNARRILRELYDRRERKIVTLALHKTRTDDAIIDMQALLQNEKVFLNELVALMNEYRARTLPEHEAPAIRQRPQVSTPKPAPEPVQDADTSSEEELVPVKFLMHVPKFVGKDLSVFGPFAQDAMAHLPASIARVLIEKGRVERVAEISTS